MRVIRWYDRLKLYADENQGSARKNAKGLLLYLDPLYGTAELIGALLVFFWYRHLSYEKFGGITGDLAGFFLQNCELFMAVCVIGLRIVLR